MSVSLHRKVMELVDPSMMVWVLEDSFDHKSLVELCQSSAISYEGMRIQSVSARRLITDIAEEFYKEEGNAQAVLKALKWTNRELIAEFGSLTVEEIENIVNDEARLLAEDRVGNVVLALAVDARPGVNDILKILVKNLRVMSYDLQTSLPRREPRSANSRKRSNERAAPQKQTQTDTSTQRLGELKARNEELERKLAEQLEERKTLVGSIDALKSENAALQQANRALGDGKALLEEQLRAVKTVKDGSPLGQILREYRRTNDNTEASDYAKAPDPFMVALGESVLELKSYVEAAAVQNTKERQELSGILEDIRKERHRPSSLGEVQDGVLRPSDESARVGLFVDVQNMFYAAKEFNARLDFNKLLKRAVGKRRLIKAIAYVVQSPEVDQSGFIAMLQQKSYEVKRKDLRSRSDGSAKGDWDMGMAIDIINLASKLDVVILVTGDGDFVSLVELLKTIGPYVEVFSFPHNTARDLVLIADKYCPIEEELLLKIEDSSS